MSEHTHPAAHHPEPGECPACDLFAVRVSHDQADAEIARLTAQVTALQGEVARMTLDRDTLEARALAAEAEVERLTRERERLGLERDMLAVGRTMTVARLGGTVEGYPTHTGNFLQRIDELRAAEAQNAALRAAIREAADAMFAMQQVGHYVSDDLDDAIRRGAALVRARAALDGGKGEGG